MTGNLHLKNLVVREKIMQLHPELTLRHIYKKVICLFKLNGIFGIKLKSRNGLIHSFLIDKLKITLQNLVP